MATMIPPKPKTPEELEREKSTLTTPPDVAINPQTQPTTSAPVAPKPAPTAPQAPAQVPAPAQAPPAAPRLTLEQRKQQQLDALRGLGGRDWREIEDADPDRELATLKHELQYGSMSPLPGTNLFYDWQGGNATSGGGMVFKDRSGKTVEGTPEQHRAALAQMDQWTNNVGASTGGQSGPGAGGGQSGTLAGDMEAFIRNLMSGKEGPFSDQMQAGLRAQSAARRSADLESGNRDAVLAATRGGTGNSPVLQSILASNSRGERAGAASDAQNIKFQAATENFKSRLTGLDQAQSTVQREYQDKWNAATNATQRYQVDQEFKAKMAEINSQKELAQQQIAASAGAAGRGRGWDLEDRADQRAYEQSIYERELPFRLFQYQMGQF